MSIYEVKEGSNFEDNIFTGLILRDEQLVYSNKAGYISYFQKEGARVSKNTSIFAVDDSTQIMDIITNGEVPLSLTMKDHAEFRYEIRNFQKVFSDDNFNSVYSFKEDAYSTVLNLLNNTMIESGHAIQEETGIMYSHDIQQSTDSGIISYYMDYYEGITPDRVTMDMYDTEKYNRIFMRSNKMIKLEDPVYKLITSEKWTIILPLTKEQYDKLSGKEQLKFTILRDDFKLTAPSTFYTNQGTNGTNFYVRLDMDKHLSNYLDERFLELEVHMEAIRGLKIPLSSIVEKDFYLVPNEYITTGGDGLKKGLIKLPDTAKGEVNITFVPTDIYYQDDTYSYIDTKLFTQGTMIKLPNSTDSYELLRTSKLTGVYNINTGYSVFKRIEQIYQDKEYCIIKEGTPNGLSVYDHIALDGSKAVEQAIIY